MLEKIDEAIKMDNPETPRTLGTQDTGRRKTTHRKLNR
jgi:hypothetical protein